MAVNAIRNSGGPFARQAPAHVDARALATTTNETHTVPAGAKYVVFGAAADFYAKPGGAAAIPSGDVTDGSASELNPVMWYVGATSTIGLISATAQTITLTFYSEE